MDRVCDFQSDNPRHRPRLRAGPKILRRDLFDRLAPQRFHPKIQRARVPRTFGLICDPLHEFREERVLHMDWQSQHTVEEPLDRR